jgi:hypothetical protein
VNTPETPIRAGAVPGGADTAPAGPIIFESARRGALDFTGRDRVLQEILGWINDPKSERVMLLLAEPGWGKSSLCAWMIGQGRQPATLAEQGRRAQIMNAWSASYLCSTTSGSTINPTTFSRSIAEQLASRFADFAAALVRRAAPGQYNASITANEISGQAIGINIATQQIIVEAANARDVYEHAVRLPLVDVVAARPAGGRIFILVDGIDDALLFGRNNIVDLLLASGDFPDRVRFFLTSRREDRVRLAFPPSEHVRVVFVSDDTWRDENDKDVSAYIEWRANEPEIQAWLASTGLERAAFVKQLVDHAAGNLLFIRFVLDNPPRAGAVGVAVPTGLQAAYDGFLARIFPGVGAGPDPTWTDTGKPVLGALTVAVPAAPDDALPQWLGPSRIDQALQTVGQLTEWINDADGGSRRLYHRSLGDFLSTQRVQSTDKEPLGNRFFVDPRMQHKTITDYYFAAIKDQWDNDWHECDRYGLRQLVPHMYALHALTTVKSERVGVAERICDLALNEKFQEAQREKLGDGTATIEAIRLALDVCVETGDAASIRRRAHRVAESWEPQMRAFAAQAIADLHTRDPKAALDELKALLS